MTRRKPPPDGAEAPPVDDLLDQWVRGSYYRGYVLTKRRTDIELAVGLLGELFEIVKGNRPGKRTDERTVLALRIQRRYGLAVLRTGSDEGRELLLDLLKRLGGTSASAPRRAESLARLLSDFCADLTNIGRHNDAVEISRGVLQRPTAPTIHAYRASNLAAWLLQRAVYYRLSGEPELAIADLDAAASEIADAFDERRRIGSGGDAPPQAYALREARAIALSIKAERSAGTGDAVLVREFRELMRETELAPSWEETYLQKAYRLGRYGLAMLDLARHEGNDRMAWQARVYLQLAWDSLGNALVRPWLPVALRDAIRATGDDDGAARFGAHAADRLAIQCSDDYPAVGELRKR